QQRRHRQRLDRRPAPAQTHRHRHRLGGRVSAHPNTACGDVAYWELTPAQAVGYHARLSRMYADQATHFAALSTKYARQAEQVTLYGGGLMLLFAIIGVIGAVLS